MNDSLPSCSHTGEQVVDSSLEKIDHSQNTSFKQQISDNSEPVDCEYVNEEQDTDILNVYPQEAQIDIVNLEHTFDHEDQLNDIWTACNEEAKVRNDDLLANEEDDFNLEDEDSIPYTELDDSIDAVRHFGQIIEDEILDARPKVDEEAENCDQSQKPLFNDSLTVLVSLSYSFAAL